MQANNHQLLRIRYDANIEDNYNILVDYLNIDGCDIYFFYKI
jgi:hypothetical protein